MYDINVIASSIWDSYVDLFMIWLLYKIRNHYQQEDSCVLYAHDYVQASNNIKRTLLATKDEAESERIKF